MSWTPDDRAKILEILQDERTTRHRLGKALELLLADRGMDGDDLDRLMKDRCVPALRADIRKLPRLDEILGALVVLETDWCGFQLALETVLRREYMPGVELLDEFEAEANRRRPGAEASFVEKALENQLAMLHREKRRRELAELRTRLAAFEDQADRIRERIATLAAQEVDEPGDG